MIATRLDELALAGWLARELDRLVERLRDFSAARYRAAAPPFPTRAAAAHHLATQLARAAQGIEERAGSVQPAWRALPELPALALADALAVTGHDLLEALRGAPSGAAAWRPGGRAAAIEVAAGALAELLLHRRDLDGSPPVPAVVAAVLAVLDPAGPEVTPARFALVATARCPAYGSAG